MKLFLFINMLSLALFTSYASTSEQTKQLKNIGYEQINNSLYFSNQSTIFVELSETKVPVFLESFYSLSSREKETKLIGLSLGRKYGTTDCLQLILKRSSGELYSLCYTANGSGGGYDLTNPLPVNINLPLEKQLSIIGFKKVKNNSQVMSYKLNGKNEIIALFENDGTLKIIKPMSHNLKDELLQNIEFTGFKEKDPQDFFSKERLTFKNNILELAARAVYTPSVFISSFLKDLNKYSLEELGFNKPASYLDPSGFQVGKKNSNKIISTLKSLNELSIEEIESAARKTASCSEKSIMEQSESLIKIMLDNNTEAKSIGLSHEELAKPLDYIKTIFEKNLPSRFTWKGKEFKVDFGAIPRCGAILSPFGDKASTRIVYPTVINKTTGEKIKFSLLSGHLIRQYGFYGTQKASNVISPRILKDFFSL